VCARARLERQRQASAILDALLRSPIDTRAQLVQNILYVGGGSMLPGFCARAAEEVVAACADESGAPKYQPLQRLVTSKVTRLKDQHVLPCSFDVGVRVFVTLGVCSVRRATRVSMAAVAQRTLARKQAHSSTSGSKHGWKQTKHAHAPAHS
jgi:hypothetical protein